MHKDIQSCDRELTLEERLELRKQLVQHVGKTYQLSTALAN